MSVQTVQNSIEQVQKDINTLNQKLTTETKKEASATDRIATIKRSITKNTSPTMLNGKQRDITRLETEIVDSQKKRAELTKKISEKTAQLYKYQQQLFQEQGKEQKKFQQNLERKEKAVTRNQEALLQQAVLSVRQTSNFSSQSMSSPMYDVFISHASEDKDEVVRPLAEKLQEAGFLVWYDEFQLKVGDSLRRSIDKGLANSRFGIVVLSSHFFAKNWPQYELDGLVAREMTGGKVILPLWHKVSKQEVISYSPSLADKVALNTSAYTPEELAKELGDVLRTSDRTD